MNKYTLFIGIILFFLWSTRALTFAPFTQLVTSTYYSYIVSNVLYITCMLLPALVYVYKVHQGTIVTYFGLSSVASRKTLLLTCSFFLIHIVSLWFFYNIKFPSFTMLMMLVFKLSWPPIAEEIMFRGVLLTELMGKYCFFKANILQALLFTGIHFYFLFLNDLNLTQKFMQLVTLFALGLIWGYVKHKNKSIVPSILWHIANNIIVSLI